MSFSLCLMLLKSADDLFHSKEHHKGLSYCKTPEIFDHPLTSPPSPKRGPDLFCPRTSILLLGVWVQLHGLSVWWAEYVCQGNNIRQDCAREPWGDLEFTVKAGQLVGIYHMWEVWQPSGTAGPLSKHIKMPLWEDKISSWLQLSR